MKNKEYYKKTLLIGFIITFILIIIYIINYINEYNKYKENTNKEIITILNNVIEKYPDVLEEELIEIINTPNNNEALKKYSIGLIDKSIVKNNDYNFKNNLIINILLMTLPIITLTILFIFHENKKSKEIKKIIKLIEEINKKNYRIDLNEMDEDELSILKSEIYKTTIMLKNEAENSQKDKLQLKDSLSDISHQLKTPLTSILILLDNLLENPEMDINTRIDFNRNIKREIININFLVQSLLKLSKIDTNTIKFNKEEVYLKDIVKSSIEKVSVLSDLKNIKINFKEKNIKTKLDKKWQEEALTNIIKNCIEHSSDNSEIDIKIDENNVYYSVTIKDYGEGINKKDLKHIFDRFYKAENSKTDSIGIGLALAKSIVTNENGNIFVESNDIGTTFIIKYYK